MQLVKWIHGWPWKCLRTLQIAGMPIAQGTAPAMLKLATLNQMLT